MSYQFLLAMSFLVNIGESLFTLKLYNGFQDFVGLERCYIVRVNFIEHDLNIVKFNTVHLRGDAHAVRTGINSFLSVAIYPGRPVPFKALIRMENGR